MTIIGIDPGNLQSAAVWWDGRVISHPTLAPNDQLRTLLQHWFGELSLEPNRCAIEMIGHYGTGMPAGKTIFDTCVWIGRFIECFSHHSTHLVLRATIKTHLCGNPRAKDPNVRQAIIDRLGAPGTKKQPGPTYGLHGDLWSALAVAITFADTYHAPD